MAKLSVVERDSVPPKKVKRLTVVEASHASERDLLVAMRTKAAMEIDSGVPAHALAPLMRQLRELDKEIRGIDTRAEQESIDSGEVGDATFDAKAL